MLVAQITDLHVGAPGSAIDAEYRTADHLARAVEHIERLDPRPDAVVCTGDLVDTGSPEEYERLVSLLEPLSSPCYVVPGNHDHRDNLRAAFSGRGHLPAAGPLHYAVDVGPLRLIALDTHLPGKASGRLDDAQLSWLDATLAQAPDRPTLLAQHHPPFATGLAAMDEMGLDGSDRLAAVVRKHPQVERILCGHVHRPIVRRFAGTIASTCPSTTHQLELDLRRSGRLAVVLEPRACELHLWTDELGLLSHTSYIGDYGTPRVIYGA